MSATRDFFCAMLFWLAILIAVLWVLVLLQGCGPTYDRYAPPATPNPWVVRQEPLCARTLTAPQYARLQVALDSWNEAVPGLLKLKATKQCEGDTPWVRVWPETMPKDEKKRCGYTTLEGIAIASDECFTQCIITHEVGHHAGLIRHAPVDEPGPMSDGDRGDCLPSPQDVAILRRTYEGKVSR